MSFRLARRKLRPLEWIQKCWMHFYCFLVKEIMKWADIFTGWFYYISLDSCKVWKHLQTLYQCCAWALRKDWWELLFWISPIVWNWLPVNSSENPHSSQSGEIERRTKMNDTNAKYPCLQTKLNAWILNSIRGIGPPIATKWAKSL